MYQEKDIPALLDEKERLKKVAKRLDQIETELDELHHEVAGLENLINDEFRDVEKLEKIGLTSLFYRILGSKEKQLERERQEYLEATLKYNAGWKQIELLQFEKQVLQEQLKNRDNLEKALDKRIREKEARIRKDDPDKAEKLTFYNNKMAAYLRGHREMKEALQTTELVLPVLDEMIQLMRAVKNWGNWDMWTKGGAGMMVGQTKHQKIEQTRKISYKAQQMLNHLSTELEDVYINRRFVFRVQIESFNHFLDIFFDNLISDWIIQHRIKNSMNNVLSVYDQVQRIRMTLESEIQKLQKEMDTLEREKKQFVIQS